MFEGKSEKEAREQILELVSEYCDRFHNQNKEYKEGERLLKYIRQGCMTMTKWSILSIHRLNSGLHRADTRHSLRVNLQDISE